MFHARANPFHSGVVTPVSRKLTISPAWLRVSAAVRCIVHLGSNWASAQSQRLLRLYSNEIFAGYIRSRGFREHKYRAIERIIEFWTVEEL